MTTPLIDDLAGTLSLVREVFVGSPAVRREIDRTLLRYAEYELDRMEQLTADRTLRDGVAMSQERVVIDGDLIPF